MAGGWDNGVAVPGGASYTAPLLNFQNIANWGRDFLQGQEGQQQLGLNDQQKQLNAARIADEQRKAQIAQTFSGGLPIDPKTGQPDYAKAAAMLAKAGDPNAVWNASDAIAMQAAGNVSPLLGGGGQPQGGQPQPAGAQASIPAKPLPPTPAGKQVGDAEGSVIARVTDAMPNASDKIGLVATNIAKSIGVDPNAALTPEQAKVADDRLQAYLKRNGVKPQGGIAPASRIDGGFTAVADASGKLPPSAVAGTPSASAGGPASPQQPQRAAAPQAPQPQPQQPQGGPITPQVPLPKGFTDPQQAILALRSEAAKLSANPRAAGQVAELNKYADRIESSLQPLSVGAQSTLIDPRSGKVLYQGPGAAAYNSGASGATLDADAERYRQTGTLPPNIGRGVQGAQESKAIRALAAQKEIEAGGDPTTWPARWQDFKAQGIGKNREEGAVGQRAGGIGLAVQEASETIPNVRTAAKVSAGKGYATWNKIENKWNVEKGDENFAYYVQQLNSLINLYGRVISGGGKGTVSDLEHGREMLNANMPLSAVEGALKGFETEIAIAEKAPEKVRAKMRGEAASATGRSGSSAAPAASGTTPGGVKWSVEP